MDQAIAVQGGGWWTWPGLVTEETLVFQLGKFSLFLQLVNHHISFSFMKIGVSVQYSTLIGVLINIVS